MALGHQDSCSLLCYSRTTVGCSQGKCFIHDIGKRVAPTAAADTLLEIPWAFESTRQLEAILSSIGNHAHRPAILAFEVFSWVKNLNTPPVIPTSTPCNQPGTHRDSDSPFCICNKYLLSSFCPSSVLLYSLPPLRLPLKPLCCVES